MGALLLLDLTATEARVLRRLLVSDGAMRWGTSPADHGALTRVRRKLRELTRPKENKDG